MLFKDKYFFLSNFYPVSVTIDINGNKVTFKNSEAAFQAQKNFELADKFSLMKGLEAKRYGEIVPITTENWDTYKLIAMAKALHAKFSNLVLFAQLKTIKEDIEQTNYWYDRFWGVCKGEGKNILGKMLMNIRDNDNNYEKLIEYINNELIKEIDNNDK